MMRRAVVLVLLAAAAGGLPSAVSARGRSHHSAPDPPTWPKQYRVKFTYELPDIKRYQEAGIKYQYQIWQDNENGMQRMERGDAHEPALETVIEDQNQNKMYTIFVHKTAKQCKVEPLGGASGPTLSQGAQPSSPDVQRSHRRHSSVSTSRKLSQWFDKPEMTYVLPEVTADRWKYTGDARQQDQTVHTWVLHTEPSEGYGHYTSNYTFTVSKDGVPIRLDIWGINPYTGGHFDHYLAKFTEFEASVPDGIFDKPELCHGDPKPATGYMPGRRFRDDIMSLLPPAFYGDEEYDRHVHQHGRRHSSRDDYLARREVFAANKRFIQEWNAQQGPIGHKLGMNHWGDWTRDEYLAHFAGNKGARAAWAAAGLRTAVHKPTLPGHMLPNVLDWRGTTADSPVKNQAACGSCWAFGAVGALETAYYRVTGKRRLFSEQNLIDCSWDIPEGELSNKGCYDGYQQIAFKYVWGAGGIAAEEEYPYVGVSGYCNTSKPLIKFKKGRTVYVKGGEKGLMEALVTKGPMTVSVDAGSESFRFYKSGIFNNTQCHVKPVTDLDHAVLVSGYGSENGQDYWIVKNTWSANWGEEGYIRIARQPADCGIATEPLYVEIELE